MKRLGSSMDMMMEPYEPWGGPSEVGELFLSW